MEVEGSKKPTERPGLHWNAVRYVRKHSNIMHLEWSKLSVNSQIQPIKQTFPWTIFCLFIYYRCPSGTSLHICGPFFVSLWRSIITALFLAAADNRKRRAICHAATSLGYLRLMIEWAQRRLRSSIFKGCLFWWGAMTVYSILGLKAVSGFGNLKPLSLRLLLW